MPCLLFVVYTDLPIGTMVIRLRSTSLTTKQPQLFQRDTYLISGSRWGRKNIYHGCRREPHLRANNLEILRRRREQDLRRKHHQGQRLHGRRSEIGHAGHFIYIRLMQKPSFTCVDIRHSIRSGTRVSLPIPGTVPTTSKQPYQIPITTTIITSVRGARLRSWQACPLQETKANKGGNADQTKRTSACKEDLAPAKKQQGKTLYIFSAQLFYKPRSGYKMPDMPGGHASPSGVLKVGSFLSN